MFQVEYDTFTTVVNVRTNEVVEIKEPWLQSLVDSILIHQSSYFDSKVQEWEEDEIVECIHTKNLDQTHA